MEVGGGRDGDGTDCGNCISWFTIWQIYLFAPSLNMSYCLKRALVWWVAALNITTV
jgi:hypothetical protein